MFSSLLAFFFTAMLTCDLVARTLPVITLNVTHLPVRYGYFTQNHYLVGFIVMQVSGKFRHDHLSSLVLKETVL